MTEHGPPALGALRSAVSEAKAQDALAPVTVLVPNNFVGLSARRALGSGDFGPLVGTRSGIVGVGFSTIYRLAELAGAARLAEGNRRPVSTPIVAAAVRQVLTGSPGYFARVADHPTTERRLVSAYRELSDLSEPQLQTLAGRGTRASEVVRIHRAVRARLQTDWYNEHDLIEAAIDQFDHDPAGLDSLGTLFLFLPEYLSPARIRLVLAAARSRPTTIVAALTGVDDADHVVHATLKQLGVNAAPVEIVAAPANMSVTSVSDADDEVRRVVRGIVNAAREGVAFDQMAVVYASEQPYVRLLHDHLGAAGIPLNGSAVQTLAESAAGRLLLRLLALPDRLYRREDVMATVSSSPLIWNGATVPARAWDQVSRNAGVVKGERDWEVRLQTFIDDALGAAADLGDDPEYESRVRRLHRDATTAKQLQTFVAFLIESLGRGVVLDSWKRRARWCRGLLDTFLGPSTDWPPSEQLALDHVHLVLDRLATLDTVEPGGSLNIFRRSLDLELDGGLGRVGSFGNGVLVGPASVTLGLRLDRVWILGMSEGSFPSRPRDDSLLPDRERQGIGVLRLRSDRTGDEHRHFRSALAAVGTNGVAHLLYPRGDLRQSNERVPSRWLVDIVQRRLGNDRISGSDIANVSVDWIEHSASFTAGVTETTFPATSQEFELASLVAHLRTHGEVEGHELLHQDDHRLANAARTQRLRLSGRFTRFDGNVSTVNMEAPGTGARATSATALETWARCPFQYYVRYVLGVDPLETPELRLRIDPLSKGTLVHEILEAFVRHRIADTDVERLAWNADDRRRLHEIADGAFATVESRGLTGEPLYWHRDQVLLRRDLDAFLALDTDRRLEGGLRPVDTELAFGLHGARAVRISLPDGREIGIRGSIDLVDETPDANLVIVDYKTGKRSPISPKDPHKNGTKLQLVLYALAARHVLDRPAAEVDSRYWHLRAADGYRQAGYAVTPAIEVEVLRAVATIVSGIEQGVFPHHPDPTTRGGWISCHYCDPDGLGVAEARRRFVRMTEDPLLGDYLALAEPKLAKAPTLPGVAPASTHG